MNNFKNIIFLVIITNYLGEITAVNIFEDKSFNTPIRTLKNLAIDKKKNLVHINDALKMNKVKMSDSKLLKHISKLLSEHLHGTKTNEEPKTELPLLPQADSFFSEPIFFENDRTAKIPQYKPILQPLIHKKVDESTFQMSLDELVQEFVNKMEAANPTHNLIIKSREYKI